MAPDSGDLEQVPTRFTPVQRATTSRQPPKISIVIVPDIGPKPQQASRRSANLWTWVYEVYPESQIWEFEYNLSENGPPVWTGLLHRSEELLEILLSFATSAKGGDNLPIVFICHSLGGLIVKRALTILHERYFDPVHQKLINLVSGVVFLGTPHPTYKNEKRWRYLGLILRSKSKFPKWVLAQAEIEAAIIANVSQKFEEIGLEIKIVSVYEQRKTKIVEGLFRSTTELVSLATISQLVDRILAETALRNEVLVGCDVDHKEIWNVSGNKDFLQQLEDLLSLAGIQGSGSDSTTVVVARNAPVEHANHDVWMSTIASEAGHPPIPATVVTSDDKTPGANVGSSDGFELIPVIKDFTAPKPATKLPTYLLKPHEVNPDFYGRDDILQIIDKALLPSNRSSVKNSHVAPGTCSFALCGLGGVGKTQIAIEFAHSRKSSFDAVFWAQADGTAKLDESYQKMAIELGLLDVIDARDLVISRNMMMQWLSTPHANSSISTETYPETKEIHWLLILDNADNLEDLQDFWPLTPNGSILITSRDPLAKCYTHLSDGTDLQPFKSQDASILLNKLSGNTDTLPTEKKALESLTRRLGGLPLAIVQFAAIIKRSDLTYAEILEMVKEEKAYGDLQKLKLKTKTVGESGIGSLADIWAVEKLAPSVLRLLELFSVLDPDNIHESFLTSETTKNSNPPKFELEHFPGTKPSYYGARTELWKSSLIVRNKHLQQLSLHRLTQDVVRARMSDERLQDTFRLALQLLSQAWPEDWMAHKTAEWTQIERLTPHVTKLHSIYEARPASATIETERELARLLQMTGWYLYERGSFNSAMQHLIIALEIYRKSPNDSPELLADTLVSLSACTKEMNDPPTHMFYAQWQFEVRMKNPSKDILMNGMSYNQLASAYGQAGRHEEAIELARKGWANNLTSPEYLAGNYFPFYAMLYEVLPLMALGRDDEASAKLSEAIAWREEKYGIDDTRSFQLGYALHMLGVIKYKHGFVAESTELWRRALANYRATMGNNYHRTGTVCAKLGGVYAQADQYETASIFFDEAERCHGLLSYFKPELARTKFLKSQFLRSIGSRDADEVYGEAASLFKTISPKTAKDAVLGAEDFDNIVFIWSR